MQKVGHVQKAKSHHSRWLFSAWVSSLKVFHLGRLLIPKQRAVIIPASLYRSSQNFSETRYQGRNGWQFGGLYLLEAGGPGTQGPTGGRMSSWPQRPQRPESGPLLLPSQDLCSDAVASQGQDARCKFSPAERDGDKTKSAYPEGVRP